MPTNNPKDWPVVVALLAVALSGLILAWECFPGHASLTTNDGWLLLANVLLVLFNAMLATFTAKLWRSTERLVTSSELTSRRQLRAYLTVLVGAAVYQERDKTLRFEGKPIIKNTGLTPAHNVGYRAKAAILPITASDSFDFPLEGDVLGAAVLGSQQIFIMSAVVDDYWDDAEVSEVKAGKEKALHVWGVVTYTDIFDDPWETEFSQILTWLPDGKVWGNYTTRHNDAT